MLQAELDALVLLAQEGNEQALSLVYRHLQPGLLRFAFRLCKDTALAHDVVQDTWLKSVKSLPRLEDPRVFKSWLYRALKWRALDEFRQHQVNENALRFLQASSQEAHESHNDEADLLGWIADLPDGEKEATYLFYQHDLQLNEIALVQDVPLGTVKSRLNRARMRIKQKLEEQDEFRRQNSPIS